MASNDDDWRPNVVISALRPSLLMILWLMGISCAIVVTVSSKLTQREHIVRRIWGHQPQTVVVARLRGGRDEVRSRCYCLSFSDGNIGLRSAATAPSAHSALRYSCAG